MTKIKSVGKWENGYNIKLERVNLSGGKIENVWCKVCKEYETQIMSYKTFSDSWIKGSKGPTSDAVEKHVTSEM